jgi:hypothetical protein
MKFTEIANQIIAEAGTDINSGNWDLGPEPRNYSPYTRRRQEQTTGEGETWDITDLETNKVVYSCGSKEDCHAWCKKQPKSKNFSFRKVKNS